MVKYLPLSFRRVRDHVYTQYTDPGFSAAKRWVRRLGWPRLIAEGAANEAGNLLKGINLSIHRNEPELHELLDAAREATNAYTTALFQENWRRFDD